MTKSISGGVNLHVSVCHHVSSCATVLLQGPDEGQVNCDNILYYKLLYQRQGSGGWQKVMVSSNEVRFSDFPPI